MPPKDSSKGLFNFFVPIKETAAAAAAPALPVLAASPRFDSREGEALNYQALGEAVATFRQPGGHSNIVINFIGMNSDEVKVFLGRSGELLDLSSALGFLMGSARIELFPGKVSVNILSRVADGTDVYINRMVKFRSGFINLSIVNLNAVRTDQQRNRIVETLQAGYEAFGAICIIKEDHLTSFADLMSRSQATYRAHQSVQAAAQEAEAIELHAIEETFESFESDEVKAQYCADVAAMKKKAPLPAPPPMRVTVQSTLSSVNSVAPAGGDMPPAGIRALGSRSGK